MKQLNKVIKISLGSTLAIFLARAFGLQYSISAGIITLLTIQDTSKETIVISLKRGAAFAFAMILSYSLFSILGFRTIAFGAFLFLFVGGCYLLKLSDGIAMNAVLATHYILSADISIGMIGNEALLLLIGAGIGTLVNLYMPSNQKQIRSQQQIIETDLRKLLFRMAYFLQEENKERYSNDCFLTLKQHLANGQKEAYVNMNNSFFQESEYYIRYMEMRKHQFQILKEIYSKVITLDYVPAQAYLLSKSIERVANSLAETNNVHQLIEEFAALETTMQESSLPATRKEFENRAVLFMILREFQMFLRVKADFADSLTKEQLQKYWS